MYEKYGLNCVEDGARSTNYNRFCAFRKKYRPNYVKHKSQSHTGFDHLQCETCEQGIRKVNELRQQRDHEMDQEKMLLLDNELKKSEGYLQAHINRSNLSRQGFHQRRVKAVYNRRRGDVSFIADASGANVSCYSPRFAGTEKGEPARHEMLKIKCTFVKVHGVGSFVVASLPELENNGTN